MVRRRFLLLVVLLFVGVGCSSPEYVRDTDDPTLDTGAMSLRLDRADLDRMYQDNAGPLFASKVVKDWEWAAAQGRAPVVAVFPMRNETTEHIEGALDALLSKIETDLVNRTPVTVVSRENQPDLIAEIKRQQSDAYDPAKLVKYGRQLGAQYFVTGKVYDVAEATDGARRVQYFMFMQVIDVETGAIRFQNEAAVSKGLR